MNKPLNEKRHGLTVAKLRKPMPLFFEITPKGTSPLPSALQERR